MEKHIRHYCTDDLEMTRAGDDIVCKDCIYRQKDVVFNGKTISKYKSGVCEKYPVVKPYEVLFNSGDCEFHKK